MERVDWHGEFVARLGMSRCRAARALSWIRCKETRADMVTEVVALAWERWVRAIEQGRDPRTFAAAIIGYCILAVKTGERLGSRNVTQDVLATRCHKLYGVRVSRLIGSSRRSSRDDVREVADRRAVDPAQLGGALADWSGFTAGLLHFHRCCAGRFIAGDSDARIARETGRDAKRVATMRRHLAHAWERYGVNPQLKEERCS